MKCDACVCQRAGTPNLNLEEAMPAHGCLDSVYGSHHHGSPNAVSDSSSLQRSSAQPHGLVDRTPSHLKVGEGNSDRHAGKIAQSPSPNSQRAKVRYDRARGQLGASKHDLNGADLLADSEQTPSPLTRIPSLIQ